MEKLKRITVEEIKSITKPTMEKLQALNIYTVYDLFMYLPYRYENYEIANLALAENNEKVSVVGQVISDPILSFYGRKRSRLTFSIAVDQMVIKIVAFNRHFLKGKIHRGMMVTVTGKYEKIRSQITANQLRLKKDSDHLEPVYTLKELRPLTFRNAIRKALDQFGQYINDDLPLSILNQYRLIDSRTMIEFAHFPMNHEQVRQVHRRVKYEELLKFELKMYYLKYKHRKARNDAEKQFDRDKVNQFIQQLPFQLTEDQMHATEAILKDLEAPYLMNRLLQGDVGSGKTVVSGIGLYANYLAGYQGAIMAPTEILAFQHYTTFKKLFDKTPITIELLTGSNTAKEKREIYERLASGEIDLIVGTHALIVDKVEFHQLGFLIIDEQHRFGVNQRKELRDKGMMTDALFLSATPIPRTLSLTVFGDMDVSIIKQLPKGRKPVKTYLVQNSLEQRIMRFVDKLCSQGEQVYVVAPLIEESEKIDLGNADDLFKKYQAQFSGKYRVGLLHGRLTNEEKDEVMDQFKRNDIQILVSTTVVEVGVDVPNATLMIIVEAHRFGLSQLHQLRGRVGRGDKQSYCILMSDQQTEKAQERLEIMTKTNDGFEIAEEDLRLRGPGDFFGSRQSGLPEFKMADIIADYKILEVARQDAVSLIESNELFHNPEYDALKQYIENEIIDSEEYFD